MIIFTKAYENLRTHKNAEYVESLSANIKRKLSQITGQQYGMFTGEFNDRQNPSVSFNLFTLVDVVWLEFAKRRHLLESNMYKKTFNDDITKDVLSIMTSHKNPSFVIPWELISGDSDLKLFSRYMMFAKYQTIVESFTNDKIIRYLDYCAFNQKALFNFVESYKDIIDVNAMRDRSFIYEYFFTKSNIKRNNVVSSIKTEIKNKPIAPQYTNNFNDDDVMNNENNISKKISIPSDSANAIYKDRNDMLMQTNKSKSNIPNTKYTKKTNATVTSKPNPSDNAVKPKIASDENNDKKPTSVFNHDTKDVFAKLTEISKYIDKLENVNPKYKNPISIISAIKDFDNQKVKIADLVCYIGLKYVDDSLDNVLADMYTIVYTGALYHNNGEEYSFIITRRVCDGKLYLFDKNDMKYFIVIEI